MKSIAPSSFYLIDDLIFTNSLSHVFEIRDRIESICWEASPLLMGSLGDEIPKIIEEIQNPIDNDKSNQ